MYSCFKQYVDYFSSVYDYFIFVQDVYSYYYVYASDKPFYVLYNQYSSSRYGYAFDLVFDYDLDISAYRYQVDIYNYSIPGSSDLSNDFNVNSDSSVRYLTYNQKNIWYASSSVAVYDTIGSMEDGSYCTASYNDGDSCGLSFIPSYDTAGVDWYLYFYNLISSGKLLNLNSGYDGYKFSIYDSSITSQDLLFTMCGSDDANYLTNYGLVENYQFSSTAWNKLSDGKPQLSVSYRMQMRVREVNSNTVYPLITVRSGYRNYDVNQSGAIKVDLKDLFSTAKIMTDGLDADVNELYTAINSCLSGASIEHYRVTSLSNSGTVGVNGEVITFGSTITETKENEVRTFEFDYFTVQATATGKSTSYTTADRTALVDLVKGKNESYSNSGVTSDSQSIDASSYISNTNYYTYNSADDNYSYYNSTTGETKTVSSPSDITFGDIVVNVDASGGGGSSGNVTQNNNNSVTVPDNINVNLNISASDGSGDNVIIEDDDLTDSGLRDDLKDGFGLLDDTNTAEKNDGFIAMISDFYSGIDSKFKTIIMFGVSTSVGIAVLRMIFKR
jgi:hypothetical protein